MKAIKDYVETHRDRFLEELFELIRIPSVSSKTEAKKDMIRAAEHINGNLLQAGADWSGVDPGPPG